MFKTQYHHYKKFANKEFAWLSTDSEELYLKNISTNYDQLLKNNCIDKVVKYKFNTYGFRCQEFNDQPSIIFLGCSITAGIGIPESESWPSLVSSQLKLQCYNLGIGGSSCDTAFRLGQCWIPQLKPSMVIILPPAVGRVELVLPTGATHDFMPKNDIDTTHPFYKSWLMHDLNIEMNQQKNILALQSICHNHGIKFNCIPLDKMKKTDLARDLIHAGTQSNYNFASIVVNTVA